MTMHITNRPLCLFATVSIMLAACVPYPSGTSIVSTQRQAQNSFYAPSAHDVPLLANKNDISLGTMYANTSLHRGFDVQAAFMPAKHFGVLGGYRSYRNKEHSEWSEGLSSFELGAGYVHDKKNLHAEVYGGIGGGDMNNAHETGYSEINFTSVFVQPTIEWHTTKRDVQIAFTSKFNHLSFSIGDTTFSNDREPFVSSQFKVLAQNPNHLFWEPGFVFRFGWRNVVIHTGYSFSTNLSSPDFHRDKNNLSIGLVVRGNFDNF